MDKKHVSKTRFIHSRYVSILSNPDAFSVSLRTVAHARQLEEEKRRVQENYNGLQALESVRVTAHDCLDCSSLPCCFRN